MWMQDCDQCTVAKLGGLQTWMRHLTDDHVLPTEWPSERASRLTGPNALKPYTTITESKKKRRKDSIPRPLNSFMLFAQHIRRNVLRIFSDASNSVISQQLGDLWRTVPRTYRNQYDIEANRLVKIHQMEFPNYKYQPKKRQIVSVSNAAENLRAHNLQSNRDADSNTSRPSHVCPIKPANEYGSYYGLTPNKSIQVNKSRVSPNLNLRRTSSAIDNKCEANSTIDSNFTFKRSLTIESSGQRFSPMKPNSSVALSRLEPKSGINTMNSNLTMKPVTTSLSSVLPPLTTSSQSNSVSTEVFSVSTCDSAYASGINSSSSSSASSPTVGELVSPAKSLSGTSNNSKCSPVCRKIQFIPIRPQSQHLLPVGTQPIRQRFLSATNGSSLSYSAATSGLSLKTRTDKPSLCHYNDVEMHDNMTSESVFFQDSQTPIQELLTPVYIQLDSERCATTEGVMLALPPGTTILHTNSGNARIPVHTIASQPARRIIVANGCKLQTNGPRSIQVLQPVKIMNVITTQTTSINDSQVAGQVHPGTLSPLPYSCNSSPSAYSPQTADIYWSVQQQQQEHQSVQQSINSVSCANSNLSNQYFHTLTNDSAPPKSTAAIYYNSIAASTLRRSDAIAIPCITECKEEVDEVINMDCCIEDSKELTTSSAISSLISDWSSPMSSVDHCETIISVNDDCMFNSHSRSTLPPLSVDVLRPGRDSLSSCPVIESDPSPNSEFQMPNDDNFDSSFDAMINSIDITTFLPGTFSSNEDHMNVEFDQELRKVSSSLFEENALLKPNDAEQTLKFMSTNDLNYSQDEGIFDISTSSAGRVFESQTSQFQRQQQQHSTIGPTKTQTTLQTQATATVRMNAFHDILNLTPQVFASNLSDLDSLDKSNLFVIKPDWSIIA